MTFHERGSVTILITDGQTLILGHEFSIIHVLDKTSNLSPYIPDDVQADRKTEGRVGSRREVPVDEIDGLLGISRNGETFEESTYDVGWEVGVSVGGVRRGHDN